MLITTIVSFSLQMIVPSISAYASTTVNMNNITTSGRLAERELESLM